MMQGHNVVLLTRPREASEKLALQLSSFGIFSHICPILTRVFISDVDWPDIDDVQALIFTSANAVAALSKADKGETYISLPCFCVGAQTAEAALQAGFHSVYASEAGVSGLIEKISHDLEGHGNVFYPRGREVAQDINDYLQRYGLSCIERRVYAMDTLRSLPDDLAVLLRSGRIAAMPFYSARTARHFAGLVREAGLEDCFSNIKALCISANVLEYVRFLNWTSTHVAQSPDGQGMEELIRKHVAVP